VERGVDLDDIRELPTVVARLEAMGPSKVRGPHCWFCGKIEAWFQCDCPEARAAQQPKHANPWYDVERDAMILDEEIIKRNLAWGFARRYIPAAPANTPAKGVHARHRVDSTVDSTVDNSVDSVDSVDSQKLSAAPTVDSVDSGGGSVDSVDKTASRLARRAEYERQRRAKQSGKQEP